MQSTIIAKVQYYRYRIGYNNRPISFTNLSVWITRHHTSYTNRSVTSLQPPRQTVDTLNRHFYLSYRDDLVRTANLTVSFTTPYALIKKYLTQLSL